MKRFNACQFVRKFFLEFLLKVWFKTLTMEPCMVFDETVRSETFCKPYLQFSRSNFIRSFFSTERKKGFEFASAARSFFGFVKTLFQSVVIALRKMIFNAGKRTFVRSAFKGLLSNQSMLCFFTVGYERLR